MEDVFARIKLTPNAPHLRSQKHFFSALVSVDKKANLANSNEYAKVLLGIHDHRVDREIASKSTNYLKFERAAFQDFTGPTKQHAANFRKKQFESVKLDHNAKTAFVAFDQHAHTIKQRKTMVDILGKFAQPALDHVNVVHFDFLHEGDTNKIRTPVQFLQHPQSEPLLLMAQEVKYTQVQIRGAPAPPKGFDLLYHSVKAPEFSFGVSLSTALIAHNTFYNQKVEGSRVRNNAWFTWKTPIQSVNQEVVQNPSNAYIRRICLASQVAEDTQVAQLTFSQPVIQFQIALATEMKPVYKAAIYSAAVASFTPIFLVQKPLRAHLPNKSQWDCIVRKITHQYMQLHLLRYHWSDFDIDNVDKILSSSGPITFFRRIRRTTQAVIPLDTILGCTTIGLKELFDNAVKGHCDQSRLTGRERTFFQESANALLESAKDFLDNETEYMDAVTAMAETFRVLTTQKGEAPLVIPALKYQHSDYDTWGVNANSTTSGKVFLPKDPLRKFVVKMFLYKCAIILEVDTI